MSFAKLSEKISQISKGNDYGGSQKFEKIEQKINDVKNNQSLFTEEEINKLLDDIKEVERISNDFKRGVLTNEEALKEATDLKEQFYNKKERTIFKQIC